MSSVVFEAADAKSQVLEMMGQVVPDHRTDNREHPTTESSATMSWHNQLNDIDWQSRASDG